MWIYKIAHIISSSCGLAIIPFYSFSSVLRQSLKTNESLHAPKHPQRAIRKRKRIRAHSWKPKVTSLNCHFGPRPKGTITPWLTHTHTRIYTSPSHSHTDTHTDIKLKLCADVNAVTGDIATRPNGRHHGQWIASHLAVRRLKIMATCG